MLPAIQSGAKHLGNNVVDSLSNVAKDTIEGNWFKTILGETYFFNNIISLK